MENVKGSISTHNKHVLARVEPIESPRKLCDCRIPCEYPFQKVFKEGDSLQGSDKNQGRLRNEGIHWNDGELFQSEISEPQM
jgi:hypothetical protein